MPTPTRPARVARATSRRTTTAALVVLAALATLLAALGPAPQAEAAGLRSPGPNWTVAQQSVGGRIALTIRWNRVAGARSYDITFAPSASGAPIYGGQIARSRSKRTVGIRATSASTQTGVVSGLAPGATYCFQVRARAGSKRGGYGNVRCKLVVNRAHAVPAAGAAPLAMATFNVCSAACSRMAPWTTRRREVVRRIQQMNVGARGRAVDVIAIEEGRQAAEDGGFLDTALRGTFENGCRARSFLQSIYVRTATYEVVSGTAGAISFAPSDPSHGACWVQVRERSTQKTVVVVALHLRNGIASSDNTIRARQTSAVLAAVRAAQPNEPIVLGGDYNSNRSRSVDAPARVMASRGFYDAYDQALAYRSYPLYNSASDDRGTIRKGLTWGDHVDRVFVSPGLAVRSWEVDYRLGRPGYYAQPLASDHNPVLVEVAIP